ncbi:MAG: SAM-dependent methyltransferase [Ideonella sp.]|nr:SAM-dependent methyltransferase [Ideonella sp.]
MNIPSDPIQAFVKALQDGALAGTLHQAVLAKYRGPDADLLRINLRSVLLRGQQQLQLVYRHATRDVTHNHPVAEAVDLVRQLLIDGQFRNAHLHTGTGDFELSITRRGQAHLRHQTPASSIPAPANAAHNREKHRMLAIDRPFLTELGVTTAQHTLVPAMARKWKQINKFIEVFASALAASRLANAPQLHIVDFGSGKGYLTFAIHDWLRQVKGVEAQVVGVELRPDLVALCNAAIGKLGLHGLRIEQGDVRSWTPAALNVVIALHACDTATDHAIDLGIRGGADIILCSPCCHKQLRPQLLSPHPLRPILQHGVHLGQEAEMLTDGLRALLLDAAGYDTQVFEFISLEHTNKNKMILAVKRASPRPPEPVLAQIAEIKAFYGIREQCLETLLQDRWLHTLGAVADNPA